MSISSEARSDPTWLTALTRLRDRTPEAQERHRVYMRDYMRKKHADPTQRALTNTQKRTRHSALKLKAVEYLGGACTDCGGVYHPAAFDFHHLDPSVKELHPGQALSGKWERAKAELDKCVLLCANCHRTRHATEQLN